MNPKAHDEITEINVLRRKVAKKLRRWNGVQPLLPFQNFHFSIPISRVRGALRVGSGLFGIPTRADIRHGSFFSAVAMSR
jgi:hypothetical protein